MLKSTVLSAIHCSEEKQGFTLIELLIVITVVGILVATVSLGLNSIRAKSRDSKRISDIKQIQAGLHLYMTDVGSYPSVLTPGNSLDYNGKTYIKKIPQNPNPKTDGTCANADYSYTQLAGGANYALDYCIGASIQNAGPGDCQAIDSYICNRPIASVLISSTIPSGRRTTGGGFFVPGTNTIIAGYGIERIYKSTDGGISWTTISTGASNTTTEAPTRLMAVSDDGQRIVLMGGPNVLQISDNGGSSWSPSTITGGLGHFMALAASTDGRYIAALNRSDNQFFMSTDYGATWTQTVDADLSSINRVAMSADGQHVYISSSSFKALVSHDYGVSFVPVSTDRLLDIDCSSDGTKIYAISSTDPSRLYYSTNSGSTFSVLASSPNVPDWNTLEVSRDGTIIVGGVSNGGYYLSRDSGATWTYKTNANTKGYWQAFGISADGTKLFIPDDSNSTVYLSPS